MTSIISIYRRFPTKESCLEHLEKSAVIPAGFYLAGVHQCETGWTQLTFTDEAQK